jgi:hypothetical protein
MANADMVIRDRRESGQCATSDDMVERFIRAHAPDVYQGG